MKVIMRCFLQLYKGNSNFLIVVVSNDEGRMEAYGAVQNELMVTTHQSTLLSWCYICNEMYVNNI